MGAFATDRSGPLQLIYLYNSPHTAQLIKSQESSYENTLGRWRKYLKRYGKASRDLSRDDLVAGVEPGVLILASAQVLDEQEKRAIQSFADRGGSIWGTWAIGSRDPSGRFLGYEYLEHLFQLRVLGKYKVDTEWFLMPFGDGPLTWPVPAGRRMSVGDISDEMLIRVQSDNLAAVFMDWMRTKEQAGPGGAIAFHESSTARFVYYAFPERVWNYHKQADWNAILDSTIAWLRREPRLFKGAWPDGRAAAHLMEMDTEDKFFSAPNFAKDLESIGVKGTFYCLTSMAVRYPDIVRDLRARGHEIAYHADVHFGFKDLDPAEQEMRVLNMKAQMKTILGDATGEATGFRAPTESYDAVTERILRRNGILHHAADPSATQDRLPFFSSAEPGLGPSAALVVLPRTQFDDVNFMRMLYGPARVEESLAYDLDLAVRSGAFSLLSVHTQNYVDGGLMAGTMGNYMKRVAEYKDRLWVARGDQIAAWWRTREPVKIQQRTGDGFIAFSADGTSGSIPSGLSVIVTHPRKGISPVVTLADGKPAKVQVKAMDAYRSAIVLDAQSPTSELFVRF
ncbi:polysaccharide deacetylase family protein [Curvibacter sp. APW13]|uniref:polysaccharide deacetylase family protein n=1 Tax=Curvibacter sp. APW13 TaxID=3077236 RepID=UPI0028DD6B44|nr:polysaccharide deacetylase family protein [Curvibacter sp. APW13]MDT8990057.1 polysaccharide deacetylase family protein [Curvibacter sp. APW13]